MRHTRNKYGAKPLSGVPRECGLLGLSKSPPSLNNVFATNRKTGRRFKTADYTAWATASAVELNRQKQWHVPGKVRVFLCFSRSDTRADLDNLIKPVLDLLVTSGRMSDDRNVVEVRASFDPILKNGTWIKIEAEALNAASEEAT